MGLDVIVFKVVMPKDTLDTVEKVSAFEAEKWMLISYSGKLSGHYRK